MPPVRMTAVMPVAIKPGDRDLAQHVEQVAGGEEDVVALRGHRRDEHADQEDRRSAPSRAWCGRAAVERRSCRRARCATAACAARASCMIALLARLAARRACRVCRPSDMTRMRSARSSSSGSSELTTTMASPSSARAGRSGRRSRCLAPTSMPRVGSSSSSTRGRVASHLPITTFCWLPPDSVPAGLLDAGAADAERSHRVARQRAPRALNERKPKPRAGGRRAAARRCRGSTRRGAGPASCGPRSPARGRAAARRAASAISTGSPSSRIVAAARARRRRRRCVSRISVRPEPSRPPMPRTSPACTVEADAAQDLAPAARVSACRSVRVRAPRARRGRRRAALGVRHRGEQLAPDHRRDDPILASARPIGAGQHMRGRRAAR